MTTSRSFGVEYAFPRQPVTVVYRAGRGGKLNDRMIWKRQNY